MAKAFKNRLHAGQELAEAITDCDLVIAIPRGGIPIAQPICEKFQCPLNLVFPRKLRAPNNPEFAIGAINSLGESILNEALCQQLHVTESYLDQEIIQQLADIRSRQKTYPSAKTPITNKHIVIVDDGIATGMTMVAAVSEIRSHKPKQITVAVPVSPPDVLGSLQNINFICLHQPKHFGSVSHFYDTFPQVETKEAIEILRKINH